MDVAALQSCRTAGLATTKDVGGSPADLSERNYLVYLTPADSMVHQSSCPRNSPIINRACPGLREHSKVLKSDYEARLRKSIAALRQGGPPAMPSDPALAKTIEDKIAQVIAALPSSGTPDALRSELADLHRQLQPAKAPTLTADEQRRYDLIMQKLNANDDVTFDEGELNYQLVKSPFRTWVTGCAPLQISSGGYLRSEFSCIPAGTFIMGSPDGEPRRKSDEGPQHQVTLTKSFEMQTTEVSRSEWAHVMGTDKTRDDRPVGGVSWFEVQTFIDKLNELKWDDYIYRLPTEAEWEYAARAGSTGAYSTAEILCEKNDQQGVIVARSTRANLWGLYAMHGNVDEYTSDWYGLYSSAPVSDPQGTSAGPGRVVRGGKFQDEAKYCRSAAREYSGRDGFHGFRLVRTKP